MKFLAISIILKIKLFWAFCLSGWLIYAVSYRDDNEINWYEMTHIQSISNWKYASFSFFDNKSTILNFGRRKTKLVSIFGLVYEIRSSKKTIHLKSSVIGLFWIFENSLEFLLFCPPYFYCDQYWIQLNLAKRLEHTRHGRNLTRKLGSEAPYIQNLNCRSFAKK